MIPSNVLLVLWLIGLGYWLLNWTGNKRTVYRPNAWPRLLFAVFVIGVLWNRKALPASWRAEIIPRTPTIEWMGVALCACGIAYAIWARRTLGTNWSANPTLKEGHELIEAGPYRHVRHPIYTGILLAIFGSCLCGGRLTDALFFIVSSVMFFAKLKVEESLMLKQFPNAYPDYMERTKALVPYVL